MTFRELFAVPDDWEITYVGPDPAARVTVEIRHADGRVETTTVKVGECIHLPPNCISYRWNP